MSNDTVPQANSWETFDEIFKLVLFGCKDKNQLAAKQKIASRTITYYVQLGEWLGFWNNEMVLTDEGKKYAVSNDKCLARDGMLRHDWFHAATKGDSFREDLEVSIYSRTELSKATISRRASGLSSLWKNLKDVKIKPIHLTRSTALSVEKRRIANCKGKVWSVSDSNELAKLVGDIFLGESRFVADAIAGIERKKVKPTKEQINEIIERLRSTDNNFHRDGWLFQHISWIAFVIDDPSCLITLPQQGTARKGFDSIAINSARNAIFLNEDKATSNPRKLVSQAMEEIIGLENNERTNEIRAKVSELLFDRDSDEIVHALREKLFSTNQRYRISVTIPKTNSDYCAVFKGFNEIVVGKKKRRRAEVLQVEVRDWMNDFAFKIVEYLRTLDV